MLKDTSRILHKWMRFGVVIDAHAGGTATEPSEAREAESETKQTRSWPPPKKTSRLSQNCEIDFASGYQPGCAIFVFHSLDFSNKCFPVPSTYGFSFCLFGLPLPPLCNRNYTFRIATKPTPLITVHPSGNTFQRGMRLFFVRSQLVAENPCL